MTKPTTTVTREQLNRLLPGPWQIASTVWLRSVLIELLLARSERTGASLAEFQNMFPDVALNESTPHRDHIE